jgi:cytochrome c oxidase subunit 2
MESFLNWFKYGLLKLPFLASEHGTHMDNMIVYVHWLMLALFVGWSIYFMIALFRFRASRHPKANYAGVRKTWSTYLETSVVSAEAVLLIGFAIPLWASAVSNPPADSDATVIRVMGRQFNWMAHYAGPDGIMGAQDASVATVADPFGVDRTNDPGAVDDVVVQGNFIVPVGKPVICHVTALDVIHSFAIHAMRVAQDAIPGLSIPVWFTPTKEGEYMITCGQLCGNSHYGMFGVLKVVSQAEYDQWLFEQSDKARATAGQPVSYE